MRPITAHPSACTLRDEAKLHRCASCPYGEAAPRIHCPLPISFCLKRDQKPRAFICSRSRAASATSRRSRSKRDTRWRACLCSPSRPATGATRARPAARGRAGTSNPRRCSCASFVIHIDSVRKKYVQYPAKQPRERGRSCPQHWKSMTSVTGWTFGSRSRNGQATSRPLRFAAKRSLNGPRRISTRARGATSPKQPPPFSPPTRSTPFAKS